jgi:hypothetical protein
MDLDELVRVIREMVGDADRGRGPDLAGE